MTEPTPEPTFPLQNRIFDALVALKAELVEAFTELGVLPGSVAILPGFDPIDIVGAGDGDQCDQLWMRMLIADIVSDVTLADGSDCGGKMQYQVEVGLLRCFDNPEGTDPYDLDELEAATKIQISDMLVIHGILQCGVWGSTSNMQYQPQGPLGGFVGGVWTVTVAY